MKYIWATLVVATLLCPTAQAQNLVRDDEGRVYEIDAGTQFLTKEERRAYENPGTYVNVGTRPNTTIVTAGPFRYRKLIAWPTVIYEQGKLVHDPLGLAEHGPVMVSLTKLACMAWAIFLAVLQWRWPRKNTDAYWEIGGILVLLYAAVISAPELTATVIGVTLVLAFVYMLFYDDWNRRRNPGDAVPGTLRLIGVTTVATLCGAAFL